MQKFNCGIGVGVASSAIFTTVETRIRAPSLSRNARFQNKTSGACDGQLERAPWQPSCTVDQGEAFAKLTGTRHARLADSNCLVFGTSPTRSHVSEAAVALDMHGVAIQTTR